MSSLHTEDGRSLCQIEARAIWWRHTGDRRFFHVAIATGLDRPAGDVLNMGDNFRAVIDDFGNLVRVS